MTSSPTNRIIHLHIPKTAGTALRQAFQDIYGGTLRTFPHRDERRYEGIDPSDYDFYSGHFGYATAARLEGDIISVFRNPVDRFISVYFFWRQLFANGVERSRNTILASKYSLDEFVLLKDEPFLVEEFFNRMTWQVAYGGSLPLRQHMRDEGKTEDEIFRLAIENVSQFAVVGLQENMGIFAGKLKERFGVTIRIPRSNVTENKMQKLEISVQTLRRIQEWVYMDLELYQHVAELP